MGSVIILRPQEEGRKVPVGRGAGVDWLLGSPESPPASLFPEAERRLFAKKQVSGKSLRVVGIEVPVVERRRALNRVLCEDLSETSLKCEILTCWV